MSRKTKKTLIMIVACIAVCSVIIAAKSVFGVAFAFNEDNTEGVAVSENGDNQEKQEPESTDNPANPGNAENAGDPANPENTGNTGDLANPEEPQNTDSPANPDEPINTEEPVIPEEPVLPEDSVIPEEPVEELAPPLEVPSDTRNDMLSKYFDEVRFSLQNKMGSLNEQFTNYETRVNTFLNTENNIKVYKLVPALQDDPLDAPQDVELFDDRPQYDYEELEKLETSNWLEILAVFVAKGSLSVKDPFDLVNMRNISLKGLDEVFNDMNQVSFERIDGSVCLVLTQRSYRDMIEYYNLSPSKARLLEQLMQPEFQRIFSALTGNSSFIDITDEEVAEILASLPEGLDVGRANVVVKARSLKGRVSYFWGGKYNEIGINPMWGALRTVTGSGSKTSGTTRPYGLDCSGFVSWVFINAANDKSVGSVIGNGSANQWQRSRSLGWDQAQPGDLAFFKTPSSPGINHVGIVVEKTADGKYMIAHCSSSRNAVVITEAWATGFRYLRRPIIFSD